MWVDIQRGTKTNPCGFILVNAFLLSYTLELFILASQVKQVLYVANNLNPKWYIVILKKQHILGVDIVDEKVYDRFDDTCPLYIDVEPIQERKEFYLLYTILIL